MAKPSTDQLCELHSQIKSGRVLDEDMQAFLENPKLWSNGQQKTHEESPQPKSVEVPESTKTSYTVTINRSDTLVKMIEKGKYDWKNDDITAKNFKVKPVKGAKEESLGVEVFHFNRSMRSEAVIEALAKLGYRPATIEELLAFGASHPEIQRQYPIVALGSSWEHPVYGRVVSCLSRHDSDRALHLYIWRREWSAPFRFLAVRA